LKTTPPWPATAALLHGNLESNAGAASAALQDSGSHLAADSANDALLYDDQPWAADSASAALGHGDYDTVAVPASAALLYALANRSAATMLWALISSCSTTTSHPLTFGMTWSSRMSSLPIFSTPGSLPHKGVSNQPCRIVPYIWISHYTRFCAFY